MDNMQILYGPYTLLLIYKKLLYIIKVLSVSRTPFNDNMKIIFTIVPEYCYLLTYRGTADEFPNIRCLHNIVVTASGFEPISIPQLHMLFVM